MKRIGNLYNKICSIDNLTLAEKKSRRGKGKQYGVKLFDINKEDNIINLHHILINKEFKTSKYYRFKIFEGKEREIFKLPYYPDRIVHHAIMNVLEKYFVNTFTSDTYSCIKGRGIHKASYNGWLSHCNSWNLQLKYLNKSYENSKNKKKKCI